MTKAKHTPGPWRWGKPKFLERPVGAIFGTTGMVCDFGDATTYYPQQGTLPNEADSALIIAAPDLLEALSDIIRIATAASVGVDGNKKRLDRARAAIAKARGEAV